MTIVSPSILAADFLNLASELDSIKVAPNLWLHLDIMDGHFVPNLSFGMPIIKKVSEHLSNAKDIKLDAHLMVSNPKFYIEELKHYNIHNFTFHLEAADESTLELINLAKEKYPSVGISIKPGTSINDLFDGILEKIDMVLIMSVEPGFGGQKFNEQSLQRIKDLSLKKKQFNFSIQVDGGISDKNAKSIIEAGADNLVAGSYIFKKEADQYLKTIESLRKFK